MKNLKYDYEKENLKVCPVCQVTIDYHVDGFNHIEPENLWYHRDHSSKEVQITLKRKLTKKEIRWIDKWEEEIVGVLLLSAYKSLLVGTTE